MAVVVTERLLARCRVLRPHLIHRPDVRRAQLRLAQAYLSVKREEEKAERFLVKAYRDVIESGPMSIDARVRPTSTICPRLEPTRYDTPFMIRNE